MLTFNTWQDLRMLRLGLALTFGLALLIGLLLAMGAARPPDVALAQGPTTRYVAPAPTGNENGNDCTNSSTPCATVQYAVDVADPGDEIRVANGTYTDVQAHAGITQVVYISQTVTVRGGYTTTNWITSYPITQPTTLDAQKQGRVLYITGEISPTIEGLRITGGDATGLGGGMSGRDAGGGAYVITATAAISSNQVFSNTARDGGGLYFDNSANVTLTDSTISNNRAGPLHGDWGGGNGGGVFFYYSPEATLSYNIFSDNGATQAGGLYFFNSPTATLTTNVISNNVAFHIGGGMKHYGGAFFEFSDNATLISNTISGNYAENKCGGVCFRASDTAVVIDNVIINNTRRPAFRGHGVGVYFEASKNASLVGNMISNNTGKGGTTYGGGLYIGANSTVALTANTISTNEATKGGGLYLSFSDATLSGNTITANTVHDYYELDGDGGGLYLDNSTATLTNTVVADNQAETAGSGLYIRGYHPRLLHTTIARNSGGDGSGVYITGTTSTVVLTNTILVSHTVGITVTADNTSILNGVLWYSNTINYGGEGYISVTNEYTGDPAFAADGYHLTLSSEAIDRGVDAGVTTDIDGYQRPCGLAPDLGADEINCLYLPVILKNSG
jgi:hypothetical protein